MSDQINVPISPGELVDKITILEIKKEFIKNDNKLKNINHEYDLLMQIYTTQISETGGISELKNKLKGKIDEVELQEGFKGIPEWHKIIMESDMATSFSKEYKSSKYKLSDKIVEAIERGMKYTSVEYNDALSKIDTANTYFKQFFHDYDAILTPSATGEAPNGLEFTGNPIFCTVWTYCGMPSISLPLLQGKNGLPIGVQLVSSLFDDERLFRNANWLTSKIKK